MLKNLVRKPFRGCMAYEFQVGKFVFMLGYPHSEMCPDKEKYTFRVFIDKYWDKRK